jgi:hypothetical protein
MNDIVINMCISICECTMVQLIGRWQWNEIRNGVVEGTWIIWFLRRGWLNAGCLVMCTQSMISPSGLCEFLRINICNKTW